MLIVNFTLSNVTWLTLSKSMKQVELETAENFQEHLRITFLKKKKIKVINEKTCVCLQSVVKYKSVPECCDGYVVQELVGNAGSGEAKCVPKCERCPASRGTCSAPNECTCDPGYQGQDCSYGKTLLALSSYTRVDEMLIFVRARFVFFSRMSGRQLGKELRELVQLPQRARLQSQEWKVRLSSRIHRIQVRSYALICDFHDLSLIIYYPRTVFSLSV